MAKDFFQKDKFKLRIKVDGKNEDSKSPSGKTATDRLAELEAEVMGAQTGLAVAKEPDNVFATHGTTKKLALFWGVLIASVILSKLPGADIFFTPLNQFATMVHEMGHAIICLFTGGHVSGMTIVADGQGHGGLTFSQGGIPFLHIQAGYLGTAVFGCLLLYLSQFHKLSKAILVAIGSLMAMASIYFILPTLLSPAFLQGLFSLIWAVAMASATIFAGVKLKDANANLVLIFLAIYTAMDSLRSISVVLSASLFGSTVWSDATVMEHNFILPAIFWSFLWATLSVVMLATTVWFTYGFGTIKGKKSKEGSNSKSGRITG